MAQGWRFVVTRLDGAGGEHSTVPGVWLDDVTIVDPLSQPQSIDGMTFDPALFTAGVSCIYPVLDGRPLGVACLVASMVDEQGETQVVASGFTSSAVGTPWTAAERRLYYYNSGDAWREIWAHLKAQPGGDLGMTLTPFDTNAWVGRRIQDKNEDGTPKVDENGQPVWSVDEPFLLSPTETADLGEPIRTLLDDGIEYRETHGLAGGHVLECGKVGNDLTRTLSFHVGVNVTQPPEKTRSASESPTEVVVVAGDGLPWWGVARLPGPGRPRQVARFTDKNATSNEDAAARAQARLDTYAARAKAYSITVIDHPRAPFGAFRPGDRISIATEPGVTQAGRITSISYNVGSGQATVDLIPAEV